MFNEDPPQFRFVCVPGNVRLAPSAVGMPDEDLLHVSDLPGFVSQRPDVFEREFPADPDRERGLMFLRLNAHFVGVPHADLEARDSRSLRAALVSPLHAASTP